MAGQSRPFPCQPKCWRSSFADRILCKTARTTGELFSVTGKQVRGIVNFFLKNWGLLFWAFLIVMYFVGKEESNKRQANHRFTVARVEDMHWISKSGRYADAVFTVAGTTYTVSADADEWISQPLMGHRFLVKYYPPDPDNSVLYLQAPVPDSISPPSQGWDAPPFFVPGEVLK